MFTSKVKKENEMKKLIEKTVSESEALANRSFFEAYSKKKDIEFLKVLELEKRTVEEIYDEYKYRSWESLSFAEREYLAKRFNIVIVSYVVGMGAIRSAKPAASLQDCIGETFEKCSIVEKHSPKEKCKSVLKDLTKTDLIILLNAIQEELDNKESETSEDKK